MWSWWTWLVITEGVEAAAADAAAAMVVVVVVAVCSSGVPTPYKHSCRQQWEKRGPDGQSALHMVVLALVVLAIVVVLAPLEGGGAVVVLWWWWYGEACCGLACLRYDPDKGLSNQVSIAWGHSEGHSHTTPHPCLDAMKQCGRRERMVRNDGE